MVINTNCVESKSCWLEILEECPNVITDRVLADAEIGKQLACCHNHDSHDFINQSKFERFILKKTYVNAPFKWDLMDENATRILESIIETEDEGPSKEWGS